MEYRKLGTTDLDVSAICLGTMTWGQQNTEAEAHQQMDYALEQGVNFFDAAELYPVPPLAETQGRTEEYIGTWFKARGNREKVILATKVTGPGAFVQHVRGGPRLDRQGIRDAVEGNLKRLQTDYIDLYQVHWPERVTNFFGKLGYVHVPDKDGVSIAETIAALDELVKEGKLRHIGISNETPWGAMQYATPPPKAKRASSAFRTRKSAEPHVRNRPGGDGHPRKGRPARVLSARLRRADRQVSERAEASRRTPEPVETLQSVHERSRHRRDGKVRRPGRRTRPRSRADGPRLR